MDIGDIDSPEDFTHKDFKVCVMYCSIGSDIIASSVTAISQIEVFTTSLGYTELQND